MFSGPKKRLLEIALVLENLGLYIYRECQGSATASREHGTCVTCAQGIAVVLAYLKVKVATDGPAYLKIKVASDVCDLYEGSHKLLYLEKWK